VYLDSAYIAKYYVSETDAALVRSLVAGAESLVSSAWCLAEVTCVFHRHAREGRLSLAEARELTRYFLRHVDSGAWTLIPVTDRLLRRITVLVNAAPRDLFLRACDAVHLATAQDQGEFEIWTNDRHLLTAAPHFGLAGRSV
jgi:predicted nucleic acid-binding protein